MNGAVLALLATLVSVIPSERSESRDLHFAPPITLRVDATDVERAIFRVSETIPVTRPGALTLLFPKWVPGNHAPTARIERLAGLVVRAGGKRLQWLRDPVDMHAFHVVVPSGTSALDVSFEYLSATSESDGRVVMTPEMLNLQWFSLVLYPAGLAAREIAVDPTVTLPDGWQLTTQLDVAARSGATVRFEPVDLEMLIDSPIFTGRHFRRFALDSIRGAPVFLDVVADAPQYLEAPSDVIDAHRRLVAEAGKLFGPPPFRRYVFMLALTHEMGSIGTEHLASSENTRPPDYLSDRQLGALLPHELTHAWNGKARRPRDLWSPDFNAPMRNSMLWLYEGQTQFWAFVLSARSGLMTHDEVMDVFARLAARHQSEPGRSWRPLRDTGNDAIMTRELIDEPWPSWHRALNDSYTEADLVWLETDGLIRERSAEKRSLDDFARTFFAGGGERASLYDLHDVVATLDRVQPYDWSSFLAARIDSTAPSAPADWLRRSGYRLIFTDTPTAAFAEHERRTNRVDLGSSLGVVLRGGSSGEVSEVLWNSPAFDAGIVSGATILSVDDDRYDSERLLAAIRRNRDGSNPIRLVVKNRGRERAMTIDYRGGLRFPRLERVGGVPDRLGALLTSPRPPRTSTSASGP
ncbi:MAG: peptidase M61 [Gemmatimonadetes bacterium]|nr:MAG: peptidase M61 [Gemmatimonadota bacterium]